MNFISFPVETTNIFPLANSSVGSQLLTEWNIRSIGSVETNTKIKFFSGASFAHSMDDFAVTCQKDSEDSTISTSTVQIQPGRALVNGHFVQSLVPINIDLDDANYLAQKEGIPVLKGRLAIGLRMSYSTYNTLAETAKIEDDNGYFEGVQVVILPQKDVVLPENTDGENDFTKVNMNLLLATFNYKNGSVSSIKQNDAKIQSIEATRISGISDLLGNRYLSALGLDPNKLYIYAGKSADRSTTSGKATWCDATDSEMIWDRSPKIGISNPSHQSTFKYNEDTGKTQLVLAHKQVDGMKNTQGQSVYYQDKTLDLPTADFDTNTGGTINATYTGKIKEIRDKVDSYYRLTGGRMKAFIDVLNNRDDLPQIPRSDEPIDPPTTEEFFTELNNVKNSLNDLQNTVNGLQKKIEDDVDQKLSDAEAEMKQDNQTQLAGINSQISSINTSISSLDSRVSALELGTDSDSKTAIATLQSQVASLQSQVSQLRASLDSYYAEFASELGLHESQAEREHAQLKADLEAELDSDINALQQSIDAIQSQLRTYVDGKVKTLAAKYNVTYDYVWRPGDYVIVGQDYTVEATVEGRAPATMYVVGAPTIRTIRYVATETQVLNIADGKDNKTYSESLKALKHTVPDTLIGGVCLAESESTDNTMTQDDLIGSWDYTTYKGQPGKDYFVARVVTQSEDGKTETWKSYFYTPNLVNSQYSYQDPIWITGGVPLATESTVGGFQSVAEDDYGYGYVRIDENGRLRVVDYELLLTGVLSYQLGQDYTEGAGISLTELQSILDENVNNRTAFPNQTQITNANNENRDPYIIHLYLTLPDESGTLTLHDIGSRYDTVVYLHIRGNATSNLTLQISKCDKLRIDSNISGAPNIILNDVNLFYDAEVLDYIDTIAGLKLWYKKYDSSDPNIQLDGMTVTSLDDVEMTDNIDPWDSTYANDNHYHYAVRSLTFADDGSIIKVGMLVGDSTTANIDEGKSVFAASFTLPQTSGLAYPETKMTHRIKITGTFVSHYYVTTDDEYMMKVTEFTALTQKYDVLSRSAETTGTISFLTDAFTVQEINGVDPATTVDGWDLNTPHYFEGGMIE